MSAHPTPFFVASGGRREAPRLLLVSDQFPPGQSAGALRWQKLSAFAAERGWEMDVITRDPSTLSAQDPERLAELPAGTRVYGVVAAQPLAVRVESALRGVLRGIRGRRNDTSNGRGSDAARDAGAGSGGAPSAPTPAGPPPRLQDGAGISGSRNHSGASGRESPPPLAAAPTDSVAPEDIRFHPLDASAWRRAYTTWLDYEKQGAWAHRAETIASAVVRPGVHRAVVSCGPWHYCNHEAGRRISVRTGLPFVMDLRDPWSLRRRVSEGAATPLFFALADFHERRAVERASLVVVNAEPVRAAMAAKYPRSRARFLTVTNGYDDESVPPSRHGERFVLAYAGGIYLDRDPRLLFRAVARVARELALGPDAIGVEFIGNVDGYGGVPIAQMAREEGLDGYVTTGPARPRAGALEFLARGTMLVSLPQDSPWAIPSKIFEYMLYDAWLLVLADEGSPSALLLRGSGAYVVPARDVDAMAARIRERVEAFRRGERPQRLARETRFGRRHQARLLMDAIGQAAGEPAIAPALDPSPRPAAASA